MPRVHHVKSARKPQPQYGIEIGDSYYWWKHRVGRASIKRVSKTRPTRSQLTLSEFYQNLFEIEDNLNAQIAAAVEAQGVMDALSEAASALNDLAEECREKRGNMPDSLQDAPTGELLEERAEACETLANELEAVDEFDDDFETWASDLDFDFEIS